MRKSDFVIRITIIFDDNLKTISGSFFVADLIYETVNLTALHLHYYIVPFYIGKG